MKTPGEHKVRPYRRKDGRTRGSPVQRMRIGRVTGRICLNASYETLVGGRFLIVAVQDRFALKGEARKSSEYLICYDQLGAREGDMIAFGESREACMPFYPEKRVPIDAYNAAILDRVVVERET